MMSFRVLLVPILSLCWPSPAMGVVMKPVTWLCVLAMDLDPKVENEFLHCK